MPSQKHQPRLRGPFPNWGPLRKTHAKQARTAKLPFCSLNPTLRQMQTPVAQPQSDRTITARPPVPAMLFRTQRLAAEVGLPDLGLSWDWRYRTTILRNLTAFQTSRQEKSETNSKEDSAMRQPGHRPFPSKGHGNRERPVTQTLDLLATFRKLLDGGTQGPILPTSAFVPATRA